MAAASRLITGVAEIGAGILTVVAQIAAHEIGVRPEDVVIGDNDTARMPGPGHAGGSRQTYMVGNVVALACTRGAQTAGRGHRRRPGMWMTS